MAREDNIRTLRIEMLKCSIKEALNSFLNGIEVVPFSICKINEPSPNKYKASGTKGEQIEIGPPMIIITQ